MTHTPEPWFNEGGVIKQGHPTPTDMGQPQVDLTPVNLARIIAAVNAVAGITTEDLQKLGVGGLRAKIEGYNGRCWKKRMSKRQGKPPMSHTPEPWSLGADHKMLLEAHGKSIADVLGNVPANQVLANATRIVACVNGCAGLDPAAFWVCVEALRKIAFGNDSGLPDDMLARQAFARAKEQPSVLE